MENQNAISSDDIEVKVEDETLEQATTEPQEKSEETLTKNESSEPLNKGRDEK
jgi:hypothetical protein